jgi:hypothetical protein
VAGRVQFPMGVGERSGGREVLLRHGRVRDGAGIDSEISPVMDRTGKL